jgi:pimeloyl-ACP methyl ester carboxylesterase
MLRGAGDSARYVDPLLAPGALTGALNWYRAMGLAKRIGPVARPVTYIWSDGDPAITRGAAVRCAEHVTGPYEFVELHGVSHWIPDEAPAAVADAALRRIATADRPH